MVCRGVFMIPAMSVELSVSNALKRDSPSTRKRPESLQFLTGHVQDAILDESVRRAALIGVCPHEVLLAEGCVGETDYYSWLAAHLDTAFLSSDHVLADDVNWRAALRTGVARLADGRWLLAPRGAESVALLLRIMPEQARSRLVLATPSHVERLVVAQFAPEIAADASEALVHSRADLCARQGGGRAHAALALALLVLLPLELVHGFHAWAVVLLVLALTMCVAVLVRILATVMSLVPERPLPSLPDAALPTYTVLVALYRETEVAAQLVTAMAALDYPAAKLEVIYLVEADDTATWRALVAQALPPHHRIVKVPDGAPRTKPRALNVGLMVARGAHLVIYDAEDRPDPDQLRKAAARFHAGSPKLAVLQAYLRIENARDSWLTRLFALDYAAQFETLLPGLARLGLALPLGGTSNHFRTEILREAGGWDAWNVTEDADLGLRLARLGYRCETLRSFTLEEAPSTLRNWYPQRRRWLKGWMQTFVTHTRRPLRLVSDLGVARAAHALALLAANTFGPAVGLWITFYVLHDSIAGELLNAESGTWRRVVWLWVALAGFGVISMILPMVIAIIRVNLWTCAPWLLLRPLHWLCVSGAAFHALHDLRVRPHHWSKTRHGLARLPKDQSALVIEVASMPKSSSSVS